MRRRPVGARLAVAVAPALLLGLVVVLVGMPATAVPIRSATGKAATVVVPTSRSVVVAAPTVATTRKPTFTTTKATGTTRRSTVTTKKPVTKATVRASSPARKSSGATHSKPAATASTSLGGPTVASVDGLPVAVTLKVIEGGSSTTSVAATLAPPVTTTTTVLAAATPTTAVATTTTLTAKPSADFDVVVANPGVALTAGATAAFLVIVAPRSPVAVSVTFVVVGLPDGSTATMSPNPTAGTTELRITTAANLVPATYNVRLIGTAGSVTRTAAIAIAVAAPTATATTALTATTTSLIGTGTFALSVVGDGKRLRTGGAVSFDVTIVPGQNFPGPVSLLVTGVPSLVSAAFTATPTSSKSTLWLSTTLNPTPGTYSMVLVATSGTSVQTVPLVLIIE